MVKPALAEIHYRRPPDRLDVFRQVILAETPECIVTFLEAAAIKRPMIVAGEVVLEPGSPVVWFSFPGRWYDVGCFHREDGSFTGWYANILTPMEFLGIRREGDEKAPVPGNDGQHGEEPAAGENRDPSAPGIGAPGAPATEEAVTLRWETTDLFLDLWIGADGRVELLDEDEFEAAVAAGWLDPSMIAAARTTADWVLAEARSGNWPPPITQDWTLGRARSSLSGKL
jgi:predicted RNA-binding protein associated with RNAse of E/G family